jgi:hypothetical protein
VVVGEPRSDRVEGGPHPGVAGRQEADDRQQQAGGVQLVAVERLGEGAGLLAPAVLEDGGAKFIAGPPPALDMLGGLQRVGHVDGAVQRHPAQQLGVQVVPGLAAYLPDTLVFVLPAAPGDVGRGDQEAAGGLVEVAELVGQPVGGAEQLTVDVELALAPGVVADSHRAAVPPAGQVGKLALVRSCSPPTPNMTCRSTPRPSGLAAAPAKKPKKRAASSGQAATHRASMVRRASRTQV